MEKLCKKIHILTNKLPTHSFPFDESKIPKNGIYILFEKKEKAHGTNRIVRVGTHTGKDQLPSRLKQHFLMENKDRSIFRKNIGRCILNKNKDPYLKIWEIDLTTRENKENYKNKIKKEKQKLLEKEISKYLQNNFSFVVIQIDNKEERLDLESKIISTVSLCKECFPSKNWLGNYSTKEKIKESGLWLVNELYKTPLKEEDFEKLQN